MKIKIEDYLSEEEIKDIAEQEIRKYIVNIIGVETESGKQYSFIKKLAKQLVIEGCQELIPNFEGLINEHIKEQIKTIKLSDLFWESFGWKSEGNKIINKVLADNELLIEAKVKQIFGTE